MLSSQSKPESSREQQALQAPQKQDSARNSEVAKREDDQRYYMGSYGTFGMDTIHGRLFELQVYVDSLKFHTFMFFAFVIFALLIWPIAIFVAIPVAHIAGNDRDLQMFKVFLVMSALVGATLWCIPALIVYYGGGIDYFKELVFQKKELNILDFVDFSLSQCMILLFVVFAWMEHEISIDVQKYKESVKQSWRARHADYGLDIVFPEAQMQHMLAVLDEECKGSGTVQSTKAGGTLFIEDLVRILEVLPGWESPISLEVEDNYVAGKETGLFSALTQLSDEAREKNLWPIDIWLVRTQYYPEDTIGLQEGLGIALGNTRKMLAAVMHYVSSNIIALVVVSCLSILRTLLPRFWLWYVLGGEFWPSDKYGPSGIVVALSTLVTLLVSFFWIGLFYFVLMEYRRNLCQVVIVSSLVDARMRVVWSQSYLMSGMWFGMDPEQSEKVLSKMPLLDLRISSNVAAFWRLREYATLDRSNERMSISILLEIVLIWLALKFVATVLTIYFSKTGVPAVLVVTLFDLIVFGGMVLLSLQVALTMNSLMERHKHAFVEAKYEVTRATGKALKEGKSPETLRDLEMCRKLLIEYLDMCREYDVRDCILFGMTVTPGKVISSCATVVGMIVTLVFQSFQSGSPAPLPEPIAKKLGSSASLAALRSTVNFLSQHNRSWKTS